MKRFKNILYVVGDEDPSDSGVTRVAELAEANGARVTLARVLPDPEIPSGPIGLDFAELQRVFAEESRAGLEALAERVSDRGVDVRIRLLEGALFLSVIREVLRGGYDLVMKVAEKERGIRARFFGSDDHHLMRKCPAPVWLLSPEKRGAFDVVLAAVDLGNGGPDLLNTKIVQLASSLAMRESARLHVVHAWELFGESLLRSHRFNLSDQRLKSLVRQEGLRRAEQLEALLRTEAPDAEPELHVHKGDPPWVIARVARKVHADVLVMGTLSRSGVPGVLIGNTAEAVLARVRCAVLTVKPSGFQTPVESDD